MNKTLTLLLTVTLLAFSSLCSYAQVEGFGVVGGYTSSNTNIKANDLSVNKVAAFHAGVTHKFNMGLGFAFQPSLLYQVKAADIDYAGLGNSDFAEQVAHDFLDAQVGYLELPLQFQWGPDLLAFRPYVFAEPFIGYGLAMEAFAISESNQKNWSDANINRFEWGLGLGGGIEIWKLQFSAKYYWNFGQLCDQEGNINVYKVADTVGYAFKDKRNFTGVSFSVAFLFGKVRK